MELPQTQKGQSTAVLLVNAKSRRGAELFEEAKTEIISAGFDLIHAKSYRRTSDLVQQVQSFVGKTPLIIAGGGDGTISAVASVLAHTKTVLGVLPLGTGNAFARDLAIPFNVQGAVEVVATRRVVEVDLGTCNKNTYLNVATMGLTTQIARNLTDQNKKRFGRAVYIYASFQAVRTAKSFDLELKTENGTNNFSALQVVIGNGRFHAGPFQISFDASITNGEQQVYVVDGGSKITLLKYALLLPTGTHGFLQEVHSESAVGGTIRTSPKIAVTVDGEISQSTPLTFGTLEGALKVCVGPSFEE